MNREEPLEIEDSRLELENRIRNLLWTVSGDYKLDMKPDISLFTTESNRGPWQDFMIKIFWGFIWSKKYFFRQERVN